MTARKTGATVRPAPPAADSPAQILGAVTELYRRNPQWGGVTGDDVCVLLSFTGHAPTREVVDQTLYRLCDEGHVDMVGWVRSGYDGLPAETWVPTKGETNGGDSHIA